MELEALDENVEKVFVKSFQKKVVEKILKFVLAASSVHPLWNYFRPHLKSVHLKNIAIPGLGFNPVNVRKTCQYQLDHYLYNRNDIAIWHDAL